VLCSEKVEPYDTRAKAEGGHRTESLAEKCVKLSWRGMEWNGMLLAPFDSEDAN